MTFLEWILNKLRNNEPIDDEEFEQIPLRIEKEPLARPEQKKEDPKEDKRVIIIDL